MGEFSATPATACRIRSGPVNHGFFCTIVECGGPIPICNVESYLGRVVLHHSLLLRQPLGNRRSSIDVATVLPVRCRAALSPRVQADRTAVGELLGLCATSDQSIYHDANFPRDLQKCCAFVHTGLLASCG